MKPLITRKASASITFARGLARLALTVALALGTSVHAAPVSIVGYDVAQTPQSGFGCWSHDYNGTIMDTGRTVSGSIVCSAAGNRIADYFGGGGTLNDGLISTSPIGTHLFTTRNADDGRPISPAITLHLGGTFVISAIRLYGGDIGGNAIPGALDGMTVEIGSNSVALASTPFGTPNAIGVPADDLIDLTNTPLAGVPTNVIVLRNFTASFFGFPFDQFSIAEVEVEGDEVISVAIDIKPGDFPNSVNIGNQGTIPVAILSGPGFDAASEVDATSLTFGRTGNEDSLASCTRPKDVNKDKLPDLVCYFQTNSAGFVSGDSVGVLRGRTVDGIAIQGTDAVRIVH